MSRDELALALNKDGTETLSFFVPLDRLLPYREQSTQRNGILPYADQPASEDMNLPACNRITNAQIIAIFEVTRSHRQ